MSSVIVVASLLADFIGGLFGVVVERRFGVFVGEGFDDGNGVLDGAFLSFVSLNHPSDSSRFSIVIVWRLFLGSAGLGLSLGLLFFLPVGGLRPKLGTVTILSIFGVM